MIKAVLKRKAARSVSDACKAEESTAYVRKLKLREVFVIVRVVVVVVVVVAGAVAVVAVEKYAKFGGRGLPKAGLGRPCWLQKRRPRRFQERI